MPFSLQARVVFPVDRPPIEHGVIRIEGERILAVSATADGGGLEDLGEVALLPGLVNAHTHLEFSHLKQPLGHAGMRLANWIRLVIAERGRRDVAPTISVGAGLSESLQAGATTLGEIASKKPGHFGRLEETIFAEVIGFSRARSDSALSAAIEWLNFTQESQNTYGLNLQGNVRIGISPHAPYTVSPDLLRQLIDLANNRKLPVAMHLAESVDELEFLRDGTGPFVELLDERSMWDDGAVPRGSRPLDYLRMLADAPRALVIHGNYLSAEDWGFLAGRADRMTLVYCPRTHAYFGHTPYPLREMLTAGVRVALGTDSRASNPDLNLLAEMRHVARLHPSIDPQHILRMGTLAGAEALGRASDVGSLTPGKLANLVAVPLNTACPTATTSMLEALLAGNEAPSTVWVRGKRVQEINPW